MSKPIIHRIDDRDLRVACGRVFCAGADALLSEIRNARLEREIAETQAETDAKIDALKTPARTHGEAIRRHDEIDRLFKRMDQLSRERYGA